MILRARKVKNRHNEKPIDWISERRKICEGCPLNSKNDDTAVDVGFDYCTACSCKLEDKTACAECECGIAELIKNFNITTMEPKWGPVTTDNSKPV